MTTVVKRIAIVGGGFASLALALSKIVSPFLYQLQKSKTDEFIGNERFIYTFFSFIYFLASLDDLNKLC
jgi:hypothetical protein